MQNILTLEFRVLIYLNIFVRKLYKKYYDRIKIGTNLQENKIYIYIYCINKYNIHVLNNNISYPVIENSLNQRIKDYKSVFSKHLINPIS